MFTEWCDYLVRLSNWAPLSILIHILKANATDHLNKFCNLMNDPNLTKCLHVSQDFDSPNLSVALSPKPICSYLRRKSLKKKKQVMNVFPLIF